MNSAGSVRVSELAVCLSLFEVGSTTLFLMGGEAKQDAWLAMLIGAFAGLLLLIIHLTIHHQEPELDLFLLLKRYMGKILGTVVSLSFIGYFAYEASRNLRDLSEVTTLTLLNKTPMWLISVISLLVVANTVRYGYRVLFLICMILFPVMVFGYVLISILIPATGLFHTELSLPVLENGWGNIFKAAIPEIVSFPFGQVVLFLVFYPYARKEKNLNKIVIIAYIATAVSLTFINQLIIFVMGPDIAMFSTLPLLQTVQLIDMTEVLERMDALFTLLLFLGLGIKIAFFFQGAVIGLERITGTSYRKWILPVGFTVYGLSFLSPNFTEHLQVGRGITLIYSSPIFQVFLPLILLIVILIKKRMKTNK
ncbi:endospore germination permease [Paenibacillus illinoisensis]|uniref:GerAB/ArcD/ProY family transporter n=1 Tax=Paenibacillus illinoisensis TaxID=59845 RepID=UPI001C8D11BB|nr:endospore germination permease [Paenibacillus illinoisensis]MBY0215021.1 endospore germination permease [Paenibacillus illinoisensis]